MGRILAGYRKHPLARESIEEECPLERSLGMWAFAPTRRVTFVSAKVIKTIPVWARPSNEWENPSHSLPGSVASVPNTMARKLTPRCKTPLRSNSPSKGGRFGPEALPCPTQPHCDISNPSTSLRAGSMRNLCP